MSNVAIYLETLRDGLKDRDFEFPAAMVITKSFYQSIRDSLVDEGVIAAGEIDSRMQYWFSQYSDDCYRITSYMFQCMYKAVCDANNLKPKKDTKMQEGDIKQVPFKEQLTKYIKDISAQEIDTWHRTTVSNSAYELVDLVLRRLAKCAHTGCAGVIVGLKYVHAPKNKDIREAIVKRAVGLFKEDGGCRSEMVMKNGKPYIHVYYPEGDDVGAI